MKINALFYETASPQALKRFKLLMLMLMWGLQEFSCYWPKTRTCIRAYRCCSCQSSA